MAVTEHKAHAPRSVRCFIVTVSDTRTEETDTSGRAIAELMQAAGHQVAGRSLVKDEPVQVRALIEQLVQEPDVEAIIATGGTGISRRDSTFEAIDGLLQKRLDGFGELFRMLSFAEIGSAAMLSRAVAGTVAGKAIFVLPGSESAVRLGVTKLIAPELGHIVQQLRQ